MVEMTRTFDELRAEARENVETAGLRARLLISLRRLDAMLLEWRAWDEDQQRPSALRQGLAVPNFDRDTLTRLRTDVLGHLHTLAAMGW
jgi:hypothetical protein